METGNQVAVSLTKLYPTWDTKEYKKTIEGTYWIYDSKVKNNRIRVTDSEDKVGKPCSMTGWIDISAIEVQ